MQSKELLEDLSIIVRYIDHLNFEGNSVLITGSTGLIGSLLVKSFIEYNKQNNNKFVIYAFARNKEKVKKVYKDYFNDINDSIKFNTFFIFQDIKDDILLNTQVDYIIHTANPTSSKYMINYPVEVINDIYLGSKNILEYAKNNKIKGLVYLSSMEVFGIIDKENRIGEEELGYIDTQNIRNCYPESKRLVECMCKSYAEEYSLPIKVARLSQVFGAGVSSNETRVFAQFLKSVLNNEYIILHTEGKSIGNYCYTRDAIRAILLLLIKGENGEVYNVVNEKSSMSIYEMAMLVIGVVENKNSKVVFDIPKNNSYGYASDTKMYLSAKKIRKLGWKPEIDMREAYLRMIPDLKNR